MSAAARYKTHKDILMAWADNLKSDGRDKFHFHESRYQYACAAVSIMLNVPIRNVVSWVVHNHIPRRVWRLFVWACRKQGLDDVTFELLEELS